jgi:hypothetical protein
VRLPICFFTPYRPWGPKRGSRGIALPFREPRHEEGMGWLAPRPGRFTPWKETRYQLYRRLGGPQGRSGRVRKISPPLGFDPRTVQPVAIRYTDWAIAAHTSSYRQNILKELKLIFAKFRTNVMPPAVTLNLHVLIRYSQRLQQSDAHISEVVTTKSAT